MQPTVLVIFGVTGDLSRRYLLPALQAIKDAGRLPDKFKVLGISRRKVTLDDVATAKVSTIKRHLEILQMDTDDPAEYKGLRQKINAQGFAGGFQLMFYLTIPPGAVGGVIKNLGEAGLNSDSVKLLLEKPFGSDFSSAQMLVEDISGYFSEEQVYRIDHYLAKEVAQNIVVFLGSNALFSDVWNGKYIQAIEIIAAEKIGIEGRATLWEDTGTLRDFVQSHLLQLAALTLMGPCRDVFNLSQVAQKRAQALGRIMPADPQKLIAGQYESYKSEVKNPASNSETFISMELESSDKRWAGVPVRLISGKKLSEKLTEIRISFKKPVGTRRNVLVLRIQPKEGIELDLWIKQPGYERKHQKLSLSFSYGQHFSNLPDAYEQVLLDAMTGSHGLFASSREVLTSWKILQPVLDVWSKAKPVFTYKDGAPAEDILKTAFK